MTDPHGPHPLPRLCEWCSEPLTGSQTVACGASHRLKRWRWLNGIPVSPYAGMERPPEGSPLLDGFAASGAVRTPSQGSRVSNGGLQVSVGRMLEVLQGEPFWLTESWARELVGRALSDRQRERFEAGDRPRVLAGQLDLEGEVAA